MQATARAPLNRVLENEIFMGDVRGTLALMAKAGQQPFRLLFAVEIRNVTVGYGYRD